MTNIENNLWTAYHEAGLNVFALNDIKEPAYGTMWTRWPNDHYKAITALGGIACRDGIECIDVDEKNRPGLVNAYLGALEEAGIEIPPEVASQKTINGGLHLVYRTNIIEGNQKLAIDGEDKRKVLIETRGKGGYFAVYPSPGYTLLQGDFTALPLISDELRNALIGAARAFNEQAPRMAHTAQPRAATGTSPFDLYNATDGVLSVLEGHGWRQCGQQNDRLYFTRPDKPRGKSASFNTSTRIFWVFSSSTIFETERGYTPAAVLTFLDFAGDFKAAAAHLMAQGFTPQPFDHTKAWEDTPPPDELDRYQVTRSGIYTPLNPIVSAPCGTPFLWTGGLLSVVGSSKSGKTHLLDAIVRTAAGSPSWGLKLEGPPKAVLHLDMEMEKVLAQKHLLRMPESVLMYSLRSVSAAKLPGFVNALIKKHSPDVLVLDTAADMVSDVNESKETTPLIGALMELADQGLAIMTTLHFNPSSDTKTRGHLGSQIERKTTHQLKIAKDKDDTETKRIESQLSRLKPISPFFVWWNDQASDFVTTTPKDKGKEMEERKINIAEALPAALMDLCTSFQVNPDAMRKTLKGMGCIYDHASKLWKAPN